MLSYFSMECGNVWKFGTVHLVIETSWQARSVGSNREREEKMERKREREGGRHWSTNYYATRASGSSYLTGGLFLTPPISSSVSLPKNLYPSSSILSFKSLVVRVSLGGDVVCRSFSFCTICIMFLSPSRFSQAQNTPYRTYIYIHPQRRGGWEERRSTTKSHQRSLHLLWNTATRFQHLRPR